MCLLRAGFTDEALAVARKNKNAEVMVMGALLKGAGDIDVGPLREAADGGNAEAAAFLVLGGAAGQATVEDFELAWPVLRRAPHWVHRRYGDRIIETLSQFDRRASLYNWADTLAHLAKAAPNDEETMVLLRRAHFTMARADDLRGDSARALHYYQLTTELEPEWIDPIHVEAAFRAVALKWRNGQIRTGEAVSALEDLVAIFPEGKLGAQMRLALVRAYTYNSQPGRALRSIEALEHPYLSVFVDDEVVRAAAGDLMATLFTGPTEAPIIIRITAYERLRPYLAQPQAAAIDFAASQQFQAAGLTKMSLVALEKIEMEALQPASFDRWSALATLADQHGRPDLAMAALKNAIAAADAREEANAAQHLAAKIIPLSEIAARDETSLPLEKSARGQVGDRFYAAGDWSAAAESYEAMGLEPENPRHVVAAFLGKELRRSPKGDHPLLNAIAEKDVPVVKNAADFRLLLEETDRVLTLRERMKPADLPPSPTAQLPTREAPVF